MILSKNIQEDTTINVLIALMGTCCDFCKNKSKECFYNIEAHEDGLEDCFFFEEQKNV